LASALKRSSSFARKAVVISECGQTANDLVEAGVDVEQVLVD
jgi:hypothetical protein